jgi:NAD(P)-dependent dehydrogenase (short-subunit alcohol dehydrogenase family)
MSTNIESWASNHIPPQAGRLAVITRASGELGFATALALARAGADVILAVENEMDGRAAVTMIRQAAPSVLVRFEKLDFGSLSSIAEFGAGMTAAGRPVDLLINLSGGVIQGRRQVTEDGFERNFGTNYLGHFALTGRLLPLLRNSRRPRVVHLSGPSHHRGSIHFDDLQLERGFDPWKAHSQSGLATLIFAQELERRSTAQGWGILSVAADPGNLRAELNGNRLDPRSVLSKVRGALGVMAGRSHTQGVLSVLFAAAGLNVRRGGYYSPVDPMEPIGVPEAAEIGAKARDREVAERLWAVSEELTGVKWPAE